MSKYSKYKAILIFFANYVHWTWLNGILVIYESYDVLGVILVYMENCPTIIKLSDELLLDLALNEINPYST